MKIFNKKQINRQFSTKKKIDDIARKKSFLCVGLDTDLKKAVLLALTSSKGSHDFQFTADTEGERLFERMLCVSQQWDTDEQMMYVVGATQGKLFEVIRRIAPRHFLLMSGVGAQGGSLEEVCCYGMTPRCELLVNSSRGIIYADSDEDFAKVAGEKGRELQEQMLQLLK